MQKRQRKQYIVATLRDGVLRRKIITQKERRRLDFKDVDVEIDESRGIVYVKNANGKIEEKHLAKRIWDLLVDIFWSEGDRYELLSNGNVNQVVRLLRAAFGDSKSRDPKDPDAKPGERFFITDANPTYSIRLNTRKTWRFIEVLAEAPKSVKEDCDS
jgi:hypothetical protein